MAIEDQVEYPRYEGHTCHLPIWPGTYREELWSRDALLCGACEHQDHDYQSAVQEAEFAALCAGHCQQIRVRVNREGKTYIRHVADCANGQHAIKRATWAAEEQRDNEAYARRREAGIFTADDLPF